MNKKTGILTLAVAIGAAMLYYFGVAGYVFEHDTLYLSTVIAAFASWSYVHGLHSPRHSDRYAEICVGLGLLGTVIGLSQGFEAVEASGNGSDALAGAFTAFHTTATGLTGAMILRIQSWFAEGTL